jgi:CBS domain-containing protein
VVGEEGKLKGLVTLRELDEDVFLSVLPEEFFGGLDGYELASKIIGGEMTASSIMINPVSVRLSDPITEAFRKMYQHHLEGLPVVDRNNKVIGYLSMVDLLALWLKKKQTRKKSTKKS